MMRCCDGIAVPLAALRAISWRCVKNVVDAMTMMAMTVTIRTVDGSAPNDSALDAVLKPSASGTPKTLAWPAVQRVSGDQPYFAEPNPLGLVCRYAVHAATPLLVAPAWPPCSAM